MSTLADPKKAYLWEDFDAFRAPMHTAAPTAETIFTTAPTTGTESAAVTWDAFGGIEAGFEVNPERDVKKLHVSNFKKSAYRISRGPKSNQIAIKPVDYSKATITTILQGGSIKEVTSGASKYYVWEEGDAEDFALLLNATDGTAKSAFYCPRVTFAAPPPRKFTTEDLDGFELKLECLAELQYITSTNPLATAP